METKTLNQVVTLARRKGILRPRDLGTLDIPRQYLLFACRQGKLQRVGRGLYKVVGGRTTEHQSLAQVAKKAPAAVICLLSALRFHDLTTQNPFAVWIAIGERAHLPRIDTVAIRVARFSASTLGEGIETHTIGGVSVKVFGPAKTVADCFKYRNKIGVNIAIEALRDCLQQRKASIDSLVHYARLCRVERIMSPYLEALL